MENARNIVFFFGLLFSGIGIERVIEGKKDWWQSFLFGILLFGIALLLHYLNKRSIKKDNDNKKGQATPSTSSLNPDSSNKMSYQDYVFIVVQSLSAEQDPPTDSQTKQKILEDLYKYAFFSESSSEADKHKKRNCFSTTDRERFLYFVLAVFSFYKFEFDKLIDSELKDKSILDQVKFEYFDIVMRRFYLEERHIDTFLVKKQYDQWFVKYGLDVAGNLFKNLTSMAKTSEDRMRSVRSLVDFYINEQELDISANTKEDVVQDIFQYLYFESPDEYCGIEYYDDAVICTNNDREFEEYIDAIFSYHTTRFRKFPQDARVQDKDLDMFKHDLFEIIRKIRSNDETFDTDAAFTDLIFKYNIDPKDLSEANKREESANSDNQLDNEEEEEKDEKEEDIAIENDRLTSSISESLFVVENCCKKARCDFFKDAVEILDMQIYYFFTTYNNLCKVKCYSPEKLNVLSEKYTDAITKYAVDHLSLQAGFTNSLINNRLDLYEGIMQSSSGDKSGDELFCITQCIIKDRDSNCLIDTLSLDSPSKAADITENVVRIYAEILKSAPSLVGLL